MEKFKKIIVALVATAFIAMSAFVFVGCGENESDGSENAVKWSGEAGTVPTAVEQVIEIENGEQLAALALSVREGNTYKDVTVKLMADINLDKKAWTPIGKVIGYPAVAFAGTFDGDGHTIFNLKSTDTTAVYATAGLFGSITGTVKNLNIKNVELSGSHFAGAIAGYTDANAKIENCKVENGTITSTPELIGTEYDNGDKVGGIIGYGRKLTVSGCSVKNVTIKGYRDLGGIIGCADGYVTLTNNSVSGVKIKVDNSHNYKNLANLDAHNAGSIAGRTQGEEVTNTGNSGNADIAFAD